MRIVYFTNKCDRMSFSLLCGPLSKKSANYCRETRRHPNFLSGNIKGTRGEYAAYHDHSVVSDKNRVISFLVGWSIKDVEGMNDAHAELQISMGEDG